MYELRPQNEPQPQFYLRNMVQFKMTDKAQ